MYVCILDADDCGVLVIESRTPWTCNRTRYILLGVHGGTHILHIEINYLKKDECK